MGEDDELEDELRASKERREYGLYENKQGHFMKDCPYKGSARPGEAGCPKCRPNPNPNPNPSSGARCGKCGHSEESCVCSRGGGGVPDAADRFAEYDQEHYQRGRRKSKRRKSKRRKSKKKKSKKKKSRTRRRRR